VANPDPKLRYSGRVHNVASYLERWACPPDHVSPLIVTLKGLSLYMPLVQKVLIRRPPDNNGILHPFILHHTGSQYRRNQQSFYLYSLVYFLTFKSETRVLSTCSK